MHTYMHARVQYVPESRFSPMTTTATIAMIRSERSGPGSTARYGRTRALCHQTEVVTVVVVGERVVVLGERVVVPD